MKRDDKNSVQVLFLVGVELKKFLYSFATVSDTVLFFFFFFFCNCNYTILQVIVSIVTTNAFFRYFGLKIYDMEYFG